MSMLTLSRLPTWITPVRAAFFGSLLLSLAARIGGTINRDGILYVNTARAFLEGGFGAALELFRWPFLPILIAGASKITGIGLENAGYLLNAVFMAGACALLVASASPKQPAAAWAICLVALALPGVNEYRDELLREFGCWFFIVLSFWLALRWSEKPRWAAALAIQLSLGVAALFRPEAVAMFGALILWQIFEAPKGEKLKRVLMIGGPSIAALTALLALYLGGHLSPGNRLSGEFSRFSTARFDAKAETMSMAFIEYARGQARSILFFGSLALIPVKFFSKIGILIAPLACLLLSKHVRAILSHYALFAWGFLAHLMVLVVFVLDLQFLAGRYVGLLLIMAAPFVGIGFWLLCQRFPRWRAAMVATVIAAMLASATSLSPGKTQFVQAGAWLSANASESPRIYIESGRSAYFAGWHHGGGIPLKDRTPLATAVKDKKYDLLVLEVSRKETDIDAWLAQAGLQVVQRFGSPGRDAVIIAAPIGLSQDSVSNTARKRQNTGSTE
jgi:hypothetical protein